MEITNKTNWGNVLKIGGCFASWCIGSGFVTGAETRQYFCCYGIYGYIGMALAMLLHLYLITKYFNLGYEKKYTDPLQVFDYYCGPKIGKLFRVLGYGLLYTAPVVMISGFGATVAQYFNVPTQVGSIILAGICLIVILLGLKRLVEVTGACGPIIVGIALVTGIIYLCQHASGLAEGIRIAPTLGMPRIAPHWLIGTLYYTTCTPMQAAPFFVAVAANEKNRNDLMKGVVAGMAGVMIKNHYEPTGSRAVLANLHAGAVHTKAYGGIVLNETVGGLNPYAVESAVKMGAAFVWMPTRDAAYCIGQGPQERSLFMTKGIRILDDGGHLKQSVLEVLGLARALDVAVGTGHLGPEESVRLCGVEVRMGVTMVLTHPEWRRTKIDLSTQMELCRRGVVIEKNWINIVEGDCSADRMAYTISQLDPERVLLASDRGQTGSETAVSGMRSFLITLLDKGIPASDLSARDIITRASLRNAIMVSMAMGASTNSTLHIPAIASEAGIDASLDDFDELSRKVPYICNVKPSGDHALIDLEEIGGVPAVMKVLEPLLNGGAITCTGGSVTYNLKDQDVVENDILYSLEDPKRPDGGLAVLHGNLAPDGAVVKKSGIKPSMYYFEGRARVFHSMEDASAAVSGDLIKEGDVIVIRYEGPKGGPGMREMHMTTSLIVGRGMDESCALITDGRFSGSTRGPCIGHISPEAAVGGPIAAVREGDKIIIDINNRTLTLCVPEKEIKRRLSHVKPVQKQATQALRRYADLVTSADKGAVLR